MSLFQKIIIDLATLGPIGRKLPAPGTFGSIFGLLTFLLLVTFLNLSPALVTFIFAFLAIFGISICGRAEAIMEQIDPSEVIWDEFSSMPLCYIFILETLSTPLAFLDYVLILAGLIFFRFFDIIKPLGISRLQDLPLGFGIMADDIASALVSAVLLYGLKTFSLSFSYLL